MNVQVIICAIWWHLPIKSKEDGRQIPEAAKRGIPWSKRHFLNYQKETVSCAKFGEEISEVQNGHHLNPFLIKVFNFIPWRTLSLGMQSLFHNKIYRENRIYFTF